MNVTNSIQQYQKQWFEKIRPYLLKNNLNVGSGLGHFSLFAEEEGINMVSLEVAKQPGAVKVNNFVLYDGNRIPFDNDSFETSIAMYVLHHTPDRHTLLNEMRRVSSKRIILVEEIYYGIFGKIRLAILDFWVNFRLNQKSHIHWQSYFDAKYFHADIQNHEWRITHFESTRRIGFDEVLCVLEKV